MYIQPRLLANEPPAAPSSTVFGPDELAKVCDELFFGSLPVVFGVG